MLESMEHTEVTCRPCKISSADVHKTVAAATGIRCSYSHHGYTHGPHGDILSPRQPSCALQTSIELQKPSLEVATTTLTTLFLPATLNFHL